MLKGKSLFRRHSSADIFAICTKAAARAFTFSTALASPILSSHCSHLLKNHFAFFGFRPLPAMILSNSLLIWSASPARISMSSKTFHRSHRLGHWESMPSKSVRPRSASPFGDLNSSWANFDVMAMWAWEGRDCIARERRARPRSSEGGSVELKRKWA
jgi:hypothetical protein